MFYNSYSSIVWEEVQENLSKIEKCVIIEERLCKYKKERWVRDEKEDFSINYRTMYGFHPCWM